MNAWLGVLAASTSREMQAPVLYEGRHLPVNALHFPVNNFLFHQYHTVATHHAIFASHQIPIFHVYQSTQTNK